MDLGDVNAWSKQDVFSKHSLLHVLHATILNKSMPDHTTASKPSDHPPHRPNHLRTGPIKYRHMFQPGHTRTVRNAMLTVKWEDQKPTCTQRCPNHPCLTTVSCFRAKGRDLLRNSSGDPAVYSSSHPLRAHATISRHNSRMSTSPMYKPTPYTATPVTCP